MRVLFSFILIFCATLCYPQKEKTLDVNNVLLNGVHLNDSLYKCFDIFGMPSEVFMYDAWAAGENIPPSLNRYKYGENEIIANNDGPDALFSGFIIQDAKYPFVVTLKNGKNTYDIYVGSRLDEEKIRLIVPGVEFNYNGNSCSIDLCGAYTSIFKNSYLHLDYDRNHVVKYIEILYERE